MKKKVAILLDNQQGILSCYNPVNYDWDSFIWGFGLENIECHLVGEFAIGKWEDLLSYNALILEAYPTLTKFMMPLLRLRRKNRPLVIILEARSNHAASFLGNEERMKFFSWIKKADFTALWCYHGAIFYKPKCKIELCRPVPPGFRDQLVREYCKEKYIVSPIYMRGTADYNIQILYELGRTCKVPVRSSILEAGDFDFWKKHLLAYPLLTFEDQKKLYGKAFCGVKFWPTNFDIGGRISYIMAKLGTPYISTPAMIHEILFPKLCIDPYGGLEKIIKLFKQLENRNFYEEVTNYALSKCYIVEQGGRDWTFIVEKIKSH